MLPSRSMYQLWLCSHALGVVSLCQTGTDGMLHSSDSEEGQKHSAVHIYRHHCVTEVSLKLGHLLPSDLIFFVF